MAAEIRDGHDSQWLAGQADAIRALGRNVIRDILGIGTRLDEVKNALRHGEWGKWLDAEFGWSDRTALRCMDAAKAFAAKSDTVSDLPIDIGALYLLARAKTPPEVREEAVERAKRGERITAAKARGIVARKPSARLVPISSLHVHDRADPPFSWQHDSVADIAAIMVRTDRAKAERLAEALTAAVCRAAMH
jgi:hypothetical protein